ncbi:MAG TPA: response regulator [Verrucomicrobiae bacterium]|nr:response regulator [Verrucomicrobiae bacterium]
MNLNHRILIIDDNRAIHDDFRKILGGVDSNDDGLGKLEETMFRDVHKGSQNKNFETDYVLQGQDGLKFVEQALAAGRPYAMAFVDVRMPPGWDGIETTARIWEKDPDVQIVICSAYSDYSWEEMMAHLGVSDRLVILKKPFDNIEVIQLAHALTAKWNLRQMARIEMQQLESMVAARTRDLQTTNEQLKQEMAERSRAEESLRQAQKMEALGQLAGGVAHDFNNLLTVIQGYAECLLAESGQSADTLKGLQGIRQAAERAGRLTSQMLTFSRKKPIQRQDVDLNEIVSRAGGLLKRLLGENILIEVRNESVPSSVHADPVMIEQILLNLAVNARDAMPNGGKLIIRADEAEIPEGQCAGNSQARPGKFARLRVSDTGIGIAPEVLPHIFEPFFTTKEPGKGTGMGLATVYGIVQQHGGWIEVKSKPGHGTEFSVYLPFKESPHPAASGPKIKAEVVGGTETILLVEDEESVRQLTAQILQHNGYRVHEVASGREALSLWDDRAGEIDLLLTDMILPGGMSGYRLAKKLLARKENLKVAYCTGYEAENFDPDCLLREGGNFLQKPYSPDGLLNLVRCCLDGSSRT